MAAKEDKESRKPESQEKTEDEYPEDDYNCCLCDDDSKLPAEKYCRNCGILYCAKCVTTRHPSRGPLKRHTMISAQRYRMEKAKAAVVRETPVAQRDLICAIHHEPYYLYCQTCLEMACRECWYEHRTHTLLDIPTACRQQKENLETKTRSCLEMKDKMAEIMNNLKTMMDGVQNRSVHSNEETEKTYNEALVALEAWRKDSLKVVHEKYGNMQLECQEAIQLLKLQMAAVEMAKMHLTAQAENQINAEREAEVALQNSAASALQLQASSLAGPEILKPILKFVHTTCPDLVIFDNGALVHGRNTSFVQSDAQTDGRMQFGKFYWEMIINIEGEAAVKSACDIKLGLTQESCRSAAQPCAAFWGIGLVYERRLFRFETLDDYTQLKLPYEQWQPQSGTQRFGFYLDCVNRTLTVQDYNSSQQIATVNDICVSRPLVPVIRVSESVKLTARLVALETVTLPEEAEGSPEGQ